MSKLNLEQSNVQLKSDEVKQDAFKLDTSFRSGTYRRALDKLAQVEDGLAKFASEVQQEKFNAPVLDFHMEIIASPTSGSMFSNFYKVTVTMGDMEVTCSTFKYDIEHENIPNYYAFSNQVTQYHPGKDTHTCQFTLKVTHDKILSGEFSSKILNTGHVVHMLGGNMGMDFVGYITSVNTSVPYNGDYVNITVKVVGN